MAASDIIKFFCKEQNISISELARRIGQTRQNLSKKFERDTLTLAEMTQIAEILGVRFDQSFIHPNGTKFRTFENVVNENDNSATITKELMKYQDAVAENKGETKENIRNLLDAYRKIFDVDMVFILELNPDNSGITYTHVSCSDEKFNLEKLNLPLSSIQYSDFKKRYSAEGLCDCAGFVTKPQNLKSILHYGAFRGEQLDGCVGMIDCHKNRIWTQVEEDSILRLGRTLQSYITSSRLDKLLKEREIQIKKEKQNTELLKQAKIDAEAANRAKTTFLFNMSHDIRTPMNAMKGYTEMAKHHIDEKERVLDYLNKIGMAEQNLIDLINEVLDMSRIEAGKVILERNPVDLNHIFSKMITLTSPTANERGLQLNGKYHTLKNQFVYADAARLDQIIMNVLGNSLKYTACAGYITYELEQIDCPREGFGRYVFTIKDTGIGMSREFLDHIFEEFSREKTATVSGVEGTGLGMSIVKRLIDMMDGKIEIQSTVGRGTKTKITLDLEIRDNNESVDEESDEAKNADFTDKRLLLVDDNELNREIARTILEEFGFIIEEAEDGDIAVQMVREANAGWYNFILMDIQMPRMNGIQATRAIRALEPEQASIPIIAMSANAFEEDRRKSLEAGMNEHLAKPFDIPKLLKVLGKFVD